MDELLLDTCLLEVSALEVKRLFHDLAILVLDDILKNKVVLSDGNKRVCRYLLVQTLLKSVQELLPILVEGLRRMRIKDVLADDRLQRSLQLEVEHGSISQIDAIRELVSFLGKFVHIRRHVTNNDSVDDGADGLEQEGVHKFRS